jgi:nicotinamidase-related amidase
VSALPFGPLDARTLHLCIDMQRIFLEPGPWYCPAGLAVLPAALDLVEHAPERSLFTRFITATTAEAATGAWQRYYRRWHAVTQDEAGAEILDLHPALGPHAAAERVFDKPTHDAFDSPDLARHIAAAAPSALVLSGVETDVCVLATAMSAVDLGYRTVIATDAVASSVPESHAACLAHVYPRFDQQIELAGVAEILAAWSAS